MQSYWLAYHVLSVSDRNPRQKIEVLDTQPTPEQFAQVPCFQVGKISHYERVDIPGDFVDRDALDAWINRFENGPSALEVAEQRFWEKIG